MNLLKSILPLAVVAGAAYAGGTPGAVTAQKFADSFLQASGAKKSGRMFASAPALRSRTLGDMGLGSRGSGQAPPMNPIQQVAQSDPRLESAMANLVQNARNQQVIDMFSKYGSVGFTAKGGQQTTRMTEVS
tara:strand:+ start:102 stop:497 length:396 start_codon:yes stop_codon:yes gene_type:complete